MHCWSFCLFVCLLSCELWKRRVISYEPQDVEYLQNNLFQSDTGGTYNTMTNQVGFCKMQSFDTISRETSLGPSIFTSGKTTFGVGLSSLYFGNIPNEEGRLTCGMCLNITKLENFPIFSDDLTLYEKDTEMETPFTVMVFDQCNDPICQEEGFLDFDIYSDIPSRNIQFIEWNAIDCPTDEKDKIELLFCTKDTCNVENMKNFLTNEKTFSDVVYPYFVSLIPRNMKIPIAMIKIWNPSVEMFEEMIYISSIGWTFPFLFDKEEKDIKLLLISYNDIEINITIPMKELLNTKILTEYAGGVMYQTKEQF